MSFYLCRTCYGVGDISGETCPICHGTGKQIERPEPSEGQPEKAMEAAFDRAKDAKKYGDCA